MNEQKLEQGIQFLAEQGLNLYAVFDCSQFPPDIAQLMDQAGVPRDSYQRLVLIGNGGNRFWPALQSYGLRTAEPVDHFSLKLVEKFIGDFLAGPEVVMLYPSGPMIPLQRLGSLAGWSHPSPLGLGINPDYGLWFAYRVAFLTNLPLPLTEARPSASPCATCPDQPCIAACPGQAVQAGQTFGLSRCVDYRLSPAAPCQDRCLSRLACPVAPEQRYPLAQVQYHYRYSLESIRRYQQSA
jgi:hypothetical protein